jgi:hypothetical protein
VFVGKIFMIIAVEPARCGQGVRLFQEVRSPNPEAFKTSKTKRQNV